MNSDALDNTLRWLAEKAAPWALLLVPLGLFIVVDIFYERYFQLLFESVFGQTFAAIIASLSSILIGAAGFTLLLATASDFIQNDRWHGGIGVVASGILLGFEIWLIGVVMASLFPDPYIPTAFFRFLRILALIMEIRLVLNLLGQIPAKVKKSQSIKNRPSVNTPTAGIGQLKFFPDRHED